MQKFRALWPTQTDDGLPTIIVFSYAFLRPRLGFEFHSDRSFRLSGFDIFDTSRRAAQLTKIDSVEQSPSSEDNRFSANQEIPNFMELWSSSAWIARHLSLYRTRSVHAFPIQFRGNPIFRIFHVPNVMSIFRCWRRSEGTVRLLSTFRNMLSVDSEELDYHPCQLLAVLHIWRPCPPSTTWGSAITFWQGPAYHAGCWHSLCKAPKFGFEGFFFSPML